MIRFCSYSARFAVEIPAFGPPEPFVGLVLVTSESQGGASEQYRNIPITAKPTTLRQIAEALMEAADEAESRAKDLIPSKDDA